MKPAPCSAGRRPNECRTRRQILVEVGGAPRRPLAAEPDRNGPRQRDTEGAGGAGHQGIGAQAMGIRGAYGRGDRAGPRAAAGRRGLGGLGWPWREPREASGGGARAPAGGRYLGGGSCSLPRGRRRLLWSEGGRARLCCPVSAHVSSWPLGMGLYPNPSAWEFISGEGGGLSGGRAGGCCVHPPLWEGGGFAGGNSVRRG